MKTIAELLAEARGHNTSQSAEARQYAIEALCQAIEQMQPRAQAACSDGTGVCCTLCVRSSAEKERERIASLFDFGDSKAPISYGEVQRRIRESAR